MKNISVSTLLVKLFNYDIFSEMKDSDSTETIQHTVPCETDANLILQNKAASNLNTLSYNCSTRCEFLCMGNICTECSTIKPVKKSQDSIDATAKAKAPLSKTHTKKILLVLQEEPKKELENVIVRMRKKYVTKV